MGAFFLWRKLLHYKKIIFYVASITAVLVFSPSGLGHEGQPYLVIAESNYNNYDYYNKDQPRILPFNSKLGISSQTVQSNISCESLPLRSVTAIDNEDNAPLNVIDRNLNTWWSNNGQGSGIQLDLGSTKNICSVDIAWYRGDLRQNNFVISVSNDGDIFTDLFKGTSSGTTTSLEKYHEIPVSSAGRYVRITVNGNTENSWASITEVAVSGVAGSSTNTPGPMYHKWQNTAGSTSSWSAWTSLGGDLIADPSVVANQDGRLEAFVVGSDNRLHHKWQTSPGSSSSWTLFQSLEGNVRADSNPAVIANSDGRLEVFVIGADNKLYHKWQTSPGSSSSWTLFQSLEGNVRADSNPAVIANSDGRLEVFVIGTDNALHHKWQNVTQEQ